MKTEALKAILEALQKKCYDDMADETSSPEEKIEEAVAEAGDEDEDEEGEMIAEASEGEDEPEEELDPIHAALRDFMKPKSQSAVKPGTAVVIASESKSTPRAAKSEGTAMAKRGRPAKKPPFA